MQRASDHRWRWRLGALLAAIAKKLQYPALASVPVSAAMLSRVDAVTLDQTISDVAQQLVAHGVTQLPVIDGDRVLGVVTRDGLAQAHAEAGSRATVAMALSEVLQVEPSASANEVLAHLRTHPETVALVVDHGSPVGVLTVDALETYLSRAA